MLSILHRRPAWFSTSLIRLNNDLGATQLCRLGPLGERFSHRGVPALIRDALEAVGNDHPNLLLPPTDSTRENQMAAEDRETGTLIGSDKVEGTAVFGPDEMRIGSIQRVMIDKRSGRVSYAVLSFGGFLGVGDDQYPLPWESLKYDTNLGGYRTGITEKQLEGAPKYSDINDWNWDDDTRLQGVSSHYGVVPT
jgi:hypothetical protein